MQKKILIVDDDIDLVELLRFNLKNAGHAIGTAGNGVEALKKARSILPDLIVLDLMMPELDGFAVCEILRRNPKTAAIPILMLTALSSELGRVAGLECGATDYLSKPFSPKAVVARVEALLDGEPVNHTWKAGSTGYRRGGDAGASDGGSESPARCGEGEILESI